MDDTTGIIILFLMAIGMWCFVGFIIWAGNAVEKRDKRKEERKKAEQERAKNLRIHQEMLEYQQREQQRAERERVDITIEEFKLIVEDIAKHIKRLQVTIDNMRVNGIVRAQSGISIWKFWLDFNDCGYITGRYTKHTENSDSNIPDGVGRQIQERLYQTKNN